ncbi:casein kinase II, regulatory subunit [Cunninghamella echinulata]|nr:casein kinase II, regulatory subunit [Cunninghamella echinulata]
MKSTGGGSHIITSASSCSTDSRIHKHLVKFWVDRFLNLNGNDYLCKIDESYILDRFNLYKLNEYVPRYFNEALDLMTDQFDYREYDEHTRFEIEKAARHLYGLIHARFILTNSGMSKMLIKYKKNIFGYCPRYYCNQPLLPIGVSDLPKTKSIKLYCCQCIDVYNSTSPKHCHLDGAYFGTSFPHLLLQAYPSLLPTTQKQSYIPKIYGFKIASDLPTPPLIEEEEEDQQQQKNSLSTTSLSSF